MSHSRAREPQRALELHVVNIQRRDADLGPFGPLLPEARQTSGLGGRLLVLVHKLRLVSGGKNLCRPEAQYVVDDEC